MKPRNLIEYFDNPKVLELYPYGTQAQVDREMTRTRYAMLGTEMFYSGSKIRGLTIVSTYQDNDCFEAVLSDEKTYSLDQLIEMCK